jgi:hypothetical protein
MGSPSRNDTEYKTPHTQPIISWLQDKGGGREATGRGEDRREYVYVVLEEVYI